MKNAKIYYIIIACVLIFLVVAAACAQPNSNEEKTDPYKVPEMFGLSSTECTVSLTDETGTKLSVWSLPSGKSYSDIEWSSDNPDVASVSGGVVTGKSEGTATIKAQIGKYSDDCLVTVTKDVVETQSRSYDVYSDAFDYLLLNSESDGAFAKGLLSATFNGGDCVVFSLASYEEKWLLENSEYIGNAAADFLKIKMYLKDSEGKTIASSIYTNENKKSPFPFSDLFASSTSDSALFSVLKNRLTYGEEYSVTFELYTGFNTGYTVSDTFEYCKGDERHDASGTFTRTYYWRFGGDSDTHSQSQYIHNITLTFDYADYWGQNYKSASLLTISNNEVANYKAYNWVYEFTTDNTTVTLLAEKLKESYGQTDCSGQDFAQYILAFGQICFDYEYDYVQYYIADKKYSEIVDFWAYPSQTIFSGHGDCEDLAMLIAAIYKKLGYESSVIVLPAHMALGIVLDDYKNAVGEDYTYFTKDGKTFYFCESTAKSPLFVQYTYSTGSWTSYYDGVSGIKITCYLLGMTTEEYQDSDIRGIYIL